MKEEYLKQRLKLSEDLLYYINMNNYKNIEIIKKEIEDIDKITLIIDKRG